MWLDFEPARYFPLHHVLLKPPHFPQESADVIPGATHPCLPLPSSAPLTLQCPPALSPLLLLSSTLPFPPQAQSSHSRPCTVPAPLPEMRLPAPFVPSTSQVKIQPMLQGSASLHLLHIPLPQAYTQNQSACHHQPIPRAFTRKTRRRRGDEETACGGQDQLRITCLLYYVLVESPWENHSISQSLSSLSVT